MDYEKQLNKCADLELERENVFYMPTASNKRRFKADLSKHCKDEDLKLIRRQLSRLLRLCESSIINNSMEYISPWDTPNEDGELWWHREGGRGKYSVRSNSNEFQHALSYETDPMRKSLVAQSSIERDTKQIVLRENCANECGNTRCRLCLNTRAPRERSRRGKRRERGRRGFESSLNSSLEETTAYDADTESGMIRSTQHRSNGSSGYQDNPSWERESRLPSEDIHSSASYFVNDNKLLHIIQWHDSLCRAFRAIDKLLEAKDLAEQSEGTLAVRLAHVRSGILKKLQISNETIELFRRINNKGANRVEAYLHLK